MGNAAPRIRHEATAPCSGATTLVPSGRTAPRRGRKVAPDAVRGRGVEDEQKVGGGAVVMTVKVVVTRKEAERLIARLEEHSAQERKARIAEITRRLRARDDGVGSPVTCGGTWTPRLAAIQEI
ncbi:unnamed protein product [Alopecurus aequalis]